MYKNKIIFIAALIALYCSNANTDSIKDVQATCSDIGFKKETQAYDDCIIELILRKKNKEQESVHKNINSKTLLEEEQKKIIDNIMFPPSETIDDRVKLEKDAEEGNTFSEYQLGYINYIGKNVPKNNEKAFFWIQKAAIKGLTEAEYYLGIMYFYGEGTQKDNKKSLYWIQKSAQKGYFEAQYYLGNMYYTGDGVPKDYNKAVLWLEKSVNSFDEFDKAPFVLSEIYLSDEYKHKDIKKALKWLHKAAELGNAEAQFKLGVMYDIGENITQDFSKAFEWYKKSATLIESEGATYNIAKMYYFGRGVPKDSTIAATWYLKSAMLGNAMAQFNLSLMYHNGDGLIKNRVKAYAWMNLAAAQGFGNSKAARDDFEKELTQGEIIEAQKIASNWKKGSDLSISNDAVIAVEKTNTTLKKEDIKENTKEEKYFNYIIAGIMLSIFSFIVLFSKKRNSKYQLNNISYSKKLNSFQHIKNLVYKNKLNNIRDDNFTNYEYISKHDLNYDKSITTGIGGWLIFLIAGFFLGPLRNLGIINAEIISTEISYPTLLNSIDWHNYKLSAWLIFLAYTTLSLYAAFRLIKIRNLMTITIVKISLWVLTTQIFALELILPTIFFSDKLDLSAQFFGSCLSNISLATIWTLYLSKSKRIKYTYL